MFNSSGYMTAICDGLHLHFFFSKLVPVYFAFSFIKMVGGKKTFIAFLQFFVIVLENV